MANKQTIGCILCSDNGFKSLTRREMIKSELSSCCDETILLSYDDCNIDSCDSLGMFLKQNIADTLLLVPETSFCFSAERALVALKNFNGETQSIGSFLTAFGASGGFVIALAGTSLAEIEKSLEFATKEVYEYRMLDSDNLLEWRRAFEVFTFPKIVKLELTSRCNFKCKMCLFHGDEYKDAPSYVDSSDACDMEFELYKRGIDECAKWNEILPYDVQVFIANRGESLLYDRVVEAVQYATDRGVGTYLTTNAALLDSKKSLQIMRAGIRQITVSLDGIDQESVARIRINSGKYDVFENLERLLALKDEFAFDTAISLCFTKLPENEAYLEKFIDKYLSRVNSIMVQAQFRFDPALNGKIAPDLLAVLPEDGRQVCPALFGIDIQADGQTWLCPCVHQDQQATSGVLDDTHTLSSLYKSFESIRMKNLNSLYDRDFCCTPCDYWMSYYTVSLSSDMGRSKRVTPTGESYCMVDDMPCVEPEAVDNNTSHITRIRRKIASLISSLGI